MSATAIILARGGSKGLPGKNTAEVAGKPCILWTIEAALAARSVARVAVSSDDPLALAIARIFGAETVERPAALAHDTARVDDAARHAFGALGEPAGPVVILYANVPARPDGLIDRAVGLLLESGCDSVQSYAPVGKHHPWWTARIGEDGCVGPWEGETLNHGVFRRQDLPPAHVPDGGVIACTADALMLRRGAPDGPHAFFGVDRRGVVTGEGEVVDIDTRADQVLAGVLLGSKRPSQDFNTEGTEGTEKGGRVGERHDAGKSRATDGYLRDLTGTVIGCAMRVHSAMGPGLLESVYEACLMEELAARGLSVRRQLGMDIRYGERLIPSGLRLDLLIEDELVIELKAIERVLPVHEAQVLSYLRLTGRRVGLLINFHVVRLKDGIRRVVLDASPSVTTVPSVLKSIRAEKHEDR